MTELSSVSGLRGVREALAELFELVESGELVRDISRDGESDWLRRAAKLTLTLKKAQLALSLPPSPQPTCTVEPCSMPSSCKEFGYCLAKASGAQRGAQGQVQGVQAPLTENLKVGDLVLVEATISGISRFEDGQISDEDLVHLRVGNGHGSIVRRCVRTPADVSSQAGQEVTMNVEHVQHSEIGEHKIQVTAAPSAGSGQEGLREALRELLSKFECFAVRHMVSSDESELTGEFRWWPKRGNDAFITDEKYRELAALLPPASKPPAEDAKLNDEREGAEKVSQREHVDLSSFPKGTYVSMRGDGNCRVCGALKDLRMGCCFPCSEFVMGQDEMTGNKLSISAASEEKGSPSNKSIVAEILRAEPKS